MREVRVALGLFAAVIAVVVLAGGHLFNWTLVQELSAAILAVAVGEVVA